MSNEWITWRVHSSYSGLPTGPSYIHHTLRTIKRHKRVLVRERALHTHTYMLNEFIRQLKSFNQMIHCVSLPCSMHFNQHRAALSFNESLSSLSYSLCAQAAQRQTLLVAVSRRSLLCQVFPCRRSIANFSSLHSRAFSTFRCMNEMGVSGWDFVFQFGLFFQATG